MVWAMLSLTVPAVASRTDVNARQLTAATIVSLLRLVSWRAADAAAPPLTVTVVGDAVLAQALREAVQGQRVDGRPVVIAVASTVAEAAATRGPAVVVLASSHLREAATAARLLEARGVLTIGEGGGMSEAGLVLGVYLSGDRIRFDANTAAASRAGLTLSSHLLRLARIVG